MAPHHVHRRDRLLRWVATLALGATMTGASSALAIEDVACAPLLGTSLPAVPGGDAALAGPQPGPGPAGQPGRCWFAPVSLSILSADAVASGPVVVVADGSGQAVAMASDDGSEAWTYRVADEGEGQVHGLAAGPGSVYVAGPEGLTALDPADGTREWRYRVRSDAALADAVGVFWPVVHGDTVYALQSESDDMVTFERGMVALDAATGDPRWVASLEGTLGPPPSTDGAIVVVALRDGSLVALDAGSGATTWTAPTSVLEGATYIRPTIGAGLVVVGLSDGAAVALDAGTGAIVWRRPGQGEAIASISNSGTDVLVNASTTLTALDAGTGTTRWTASVQASAPMFPFASIPGRAAEVMVMGSTDAMDVASVLALDAANGTELWRVTTDAYGAILSPLVTQGRVVVPVFDMVGNSGLLSLGVPE